MRSKNAAAAAVGIGLLVFGCSSPDEHVDELARTRTQALIMGLAAMNQSRGDAPCTVDGTGEVVFAGGVRGLAGASAETFDPATRTWTVAGSMAGTRWQHASVRLATGEVFVHGGYDGGNSVLSSAERFDPATRTWRTVAASPTARGEHAAVRLLDGRVVVIGGNAGYDTDKTSSTEIYEPNADRWSVGPSMKIARGFVSATTLADGRVLVVGDPIATFGEVLAADASGWTSTGSMASPRIRPGLAALRDGRVVMAGGFDANDQPLSTVEIWDPIANAWSAGPPMHHARGSAGVNVALAPLPSGALLVAGDIYAESLERLDPSAQTWTEVGTFLEPRNPRCFAPIPGGVLFAGSGNGGETYTTEAYEGSAGGETCATDDECASGRCASGKCTAAPAPDAGSIDALGGDTSAGASADAAPPRSIGPNAMHCLADADCATGHCVDGACCDTACRDLCHSCALPGSIGHCTPEPIGVDLRGECGAALSCTGTCDGAGACIGATPGTQCASSRCTSTSTGVGPALCAAAGARCPTGAVTPFDCGPFACDPVFGACRSSCASSSDCAGGFVCDTTSGACVSPPPPTRGGGCAFGDAQAGGGFAIGLVAVALARARRRGR